MRTSLFVIAFALVVVCAFAKSKLVPSDAFVEMFKDVPEEEMNKLCDSINHKSHQLFSPFRCKRDTETASADVCKGKSIKTYNPVVLLPGLGGSGLDAKLDKDKAPSWLCIKHWDWFRIWFAIYEIAAQPCWMDNLHLSFNATTGNYSNTVGVEIRPTDFGGLEGVAYLYYLLGHGLSITSYYSEVTDCLQHVGYVPGKNLFGAPYDWRYPATFAEKIGWMAQLQELIENAYTSNGNLPVYVVTHSMGGPTGLYFLSQMSQSWRDTYIAGFVPVAGPWSGAPNALRAVVSGDNFGLSFLGIDILSKKRLRDVAREAGGVIELVPNPDLNSTKAVFVTTPSRNYTMEDFPQLFSDMGYPNTNTVYQTTKDIVESLTAPNVPVYCAYGTGVPTEVAYRYNNGFDEDPEIDDSSLGDGTVPLYSLQECQAWAKLQSKPVQWQEFPLVEHGGILKDESFLLYFLNVINGATQQ